LDRLTAITVLARRLHMFRNIGSGMLVIAVAAACGDSTGPENFDAIATQQKADLVLAAFDNNPALLSLSALEGLSFAPLVQATLPASPATMTVPATAARLRAVAGAVPSFGSAAPAAILPADLLGATFVWNDAENRFVRDSERTGAPQNGIRLILYAVDPIIHRPIEPGSENEVGYLDITDESTPAADALHLVAVVNDITYLDYVASAVTTQTSVTLSAEGYLSDGTDQVDFDLSLTATGAGETLEYTIDYLLTHDDGSIRLAGSSRDSVNEADLTLTISDGDNSIVLDVAFTPSTLSGTIEYNGVVVVEISGTQDEPVFTRTDGTPLTEQELASLRYLGFLVGVIFDHFDNLLAPALVAFLLG
jgi:hypothetical protein